MRSPSGWSIASNVRSDCIQAHVNQYLLTGALPPKGTVCPAPNPFTNVADQREAPRVLTGVPPTRPQGKHPIDTYDPVTLL